MDDSSHIPTGYTRERGPMLLKLIIPGEAAPSGSRTADPVMRKNPNFNPKRKEGPGNWRKIPVLDERNGRPIVRQRHARASTEPWMELVEYHAKMAWAGRDLLDGALWVDFESYETRPQGHYRTGRYSHLLRPDAPAYPHRTTTGDSDKLRRAIEDALTEVVWVDDKRVTWGRDEKDYVENIGETDPFAVICIGRMAAQTVADLGLPSPAAEGQVALIA